MPRVNKHIIFLSFIGAAIIFYSYAQYVALSVNGMTKHQAIILNKPETYQFDFIAERDEDYELSLEVERDLTFSKQHCLLGMQNPDCSTIEEKLNIAWSIVTNGQMIKAGQSQKSKKARIGSTISKVLTEFSGSKGQHYQISAQVVEADERLTEGNIVIAVNALLLEKTTIKQSFYSAIAYIFLLLAGLIWLFSYFKNKMDSVKTNEPDEPFV